MLNLKRTIAAAIIAVPLALAVPGLAFADTGHSTGAQSGSQDQSNGTGHSNSNIAPVTQLNPAINAQNLLGLGAAGTDRRGNGDNSHTTGRQSINQDNSVTSTNDQSNTNRTTQHQSSDQNQRHNRTRSTDQSSTQGQSNRSAQSNSNIAPVTQVNPAINAQDLLGLGGTNDRSDFDHTDQNQSSDQNTRGGLLGIL